MNEFKSHYSKVKVLDLQLNGNQINLVEKPTPRDQLTERRKVARSLRPCSLRRPMSATPYREMKREKKVPAWSRPQSAGYSSRHGLNKLVAKLSHSSLNDPDSCQDFATSYASSQLLNSLMGSFSPIDGVNSPSPQPSFDNVIAVAAQLEPGLTGKPPLPPTPQPPAIDLDDDNISLKFQRWFPDAILDSEILSKRSLSVNVLQKPKDGIDRSDSASIIDCAEFLDKEGKADKGCPDINKFNRFFSTNSANNINDNIQNQNGSHEECASPPEIVVYEPNLYESQLVTEDFTSGTKCDHALDENVAAVKSAVEGNSNSKLLLSELENVNDSSNYDQVSGYLIAQPDCDILIRKSKISTNVNQSRFENRCSDSQLHNCDYDLTKVPIYTDTRQEIGTPQNVDAFSLTYIKKSTSSTNNTIDNDSSGHVQKDSYKAEFSNGIKDLSSKEFINDTVLSETRTSPNKYLLVQQSLQTNCESEKFKGNQNCKENVHSLDTKHKLCTTIIAEKTNLSTDTLVEKNDRSKKSINHNTENPQSNKGNHSHDTGPLNLISGTPLFSGVLQRDGGESLSLDMKPKTSNLMQVQCDKFDNIYSSYNVSKNSDMDQLGSNVFLNNTSVRPNNQSKFNDIPSSNCKKITRRRSAETLTNKTPCDKSHTPKDLNRAASVTPTFKKSNSMRNFNGGRSKSPLPPKSMKSNGTKLNASSINEKSAKDSDKTSYEDIVSMISLLEKEEMKSCNGKYSSQSFENNKEPESSSSVKAILSFLDDVEKDSLRVANTKTSEILVEDDMVGRKYPATSTRTGALVSTETPELAKQVMALSLQLEESKGMFAALEERHRQALALIERQKADGREVNARHQSFIDKLLKEKQQLAIQYETALQDLKGKHETAIRVLEESHKIELKKNQDKFNAAEKIRRDKWIDAKTKKIKELTVRGLEPELERMAAAHQEELAEIRRAHGRQMAEAEAGWQRRTAVLREQDAAELQAAVRRERDAARHRVEQEIVEIEKCYQEQRRRLLEEVRQEKDMVQRQSERIISEKQALFDKQVLDLQQNLQNKLTACEKQHQEDIAKIKDCLETEKKTWKVQQIAGLEEKEAAIKDEMKMERDRHIELVIGRLEMEAAAKEQALDSKFKKLKETYTSEVNDLESELKEVRSRLKELRSDLQRSEDVNRSLTAQLSQAHAEMTPLRQSLEKHREEHGESIQEHEKKVTDLQLEIKHCKQSFLAQINKINNEKEKELQQVYSRVRDAINKKEEALQVVSQQRDAVLEQCTRLEKLLQNQRSQFL